MTLEWTTAEPDASRPERSPRRHRHVWYLTLALDVRCRRCRRLRDDDDARRGRAARRLGSDQERRIERVYGPTKIGERGDPVDHLGAIWRWQSKASRHLPSKWLAAIVRIAWRVTLPRSISGPLEAMDGLYDPRLSLVIRSYVRSGVPVRDWLFVRAADWQYVHGAPGNDEGYLVIPGLDFLDVNGRDSTP